jgi:hypothetical protein
MKRPKPKPPRAVRAWAIYSRGEILEFGAFNRLAVCPHRVGALNFGDRPVRVTIVPDATPSTEAENRRLLRRAWRELKRSPFPEDRRLADEIDAALRRRR